MDSFSIVLIAAVILVIAVAAAMPVLQEAVSRWEVRQWGRPRGSEPWYVRLYYGMQR